LKRRTQRARRILDDAGIMARSHLQNRWHVRHSAERVHRQDGLYPLERPQRMGEAFRIHVEGALIYVDKQRLPPAQRDRIGGRRPGVRRNGYQVTRPHAYSQKSEVQCRSAATHNYRIQGPRYGRNLAFEGTNPLSLHQEPGPQDL